MKRGAKAGIAAPSLRSVLVLVDESNVVSSVRAISRKLDWEALRESLVRADEGRHLLEMVVYVGLPPAMPQTNSEKSSPAACIAK